MLKDNDLRRKKAENRKEKRKERRNKRKKKSSLNRALTIVFAVVVPVVIILSLFMSTFTLVHNAYYPERTEMLSVEADDWAIALSYKVIGFTETLDFTYIIDAPNTQAVADLFIYAIANTDYVRLVFDEGYSINDLYYYLITAPRDVHGWVIKWLLPHWQDSIVNAWFGYRDDYRYLFYNRGLVDVTVILTQKINSLFSDVSNITIDVVSVVFGITLPIITVLLAIDKLYKKKEESDNKTIANFENIKE